MKLEDARKAYEAFSMKTSDVNRQLCLGGIALIWLFKGGSYSAPVLEPTLVKSALLIFVALLFDLMHYLAGTALWFGYFRHKERTEIGLEDEFLAPVWLNWPTWILFSLKVACTILAYCWFIIPFLAHRFLG